MKRSEFEKRVLDHFYPGATTSDIVKAVTGWAEKAGVQWDPEGPPKIFPGDLLTHQRSGETFIPRQVDMDSRIGDLWEIVPYPQEKGETR